jgi:hypothetical protein
MERDQVVTKIAELEAAIARWPSMNSQSNPGAMMDLRNMRKELQRFKALLIVLDRQK